MSSTSLGGGGVSPTKTAQLYYESME